MGVLIDRHGMDVTSKLTLDWLAFTIHGDSFSEMWGVVRALFAEWTELGRGLWGYTHSALLPGGGRLAWSRDDVAMGIHVSLGAQALASLRKSVGGDTLGFLRFLLDLGVTFTRVDWALDDLDCVLDLSVICDHVQAGALSTRWRKISEFRSLRGDDGCTIYFGAPSSESRLRIYNKAAESGVDYPWLRVELQLRGDRAGAMVRALLDAGPGAVVDVLWGLLDFKDVRESDSNNRRWPSARWWRRFLGAQRRARLVLPDSQRTLQTVKDWLTRQVAPSLALVVHAARGDLGFVYDLLQDGAQRLRPSHLALVPS